MVILAVCWGGSMSKHKWGILDKISKKDSIEEVYSRRVKYKLATILNDSAHPLYSDTSRMKVSGSPTRKN